VATRAIRILLEYDGSRFIGWQAQDGQQSVQGELEAAFEKLTGEHPRVRVAGRTDAGVHAQGQVVSLVTESTLSAYKLASGLNFYLPNDVVVHQVDDVPPLFDARSGSHSKVYRYRIYQAPQPSALVTKAWHLRKPLDVDAMRAASRPLLGEHDFEAFRSSQCDAAHAWRYFYSIDFVTTPRPPCGTVVDIYLRANAFCRYMCRILSGTLAEVGTGKRPQESLAQLLESRDRTKAGITAPAKGLTLLRVFYPHDPDVDSWSAPTHALP
jgi:tRNA pseudouridine38-40 synthase